AHHGAAAQVDPGRARAPGQHVLEAAAVDLPGGRGQQPADADLGAAVDVLAPFREEEAEAELPDLLVVEVVAQAEHLGEVPRADLHRGLADLEGGVRCRAVAALEQGDGEGRVGLLELQGERQARQAAPQDRDVRSPRVIHQARPPVPGGAWAPGGSAAGSAPQSSMTGGRRRVLAYSASTSPRFQTWPTTCEVIAHRSRPSRKWLLRNSRPGSEPA